MANKKVSRKRVEKPVAAGIHRAAERASIEPVEDPKQVLKGILGELDALFDAFLIISNSSPGTRDEYTLESMRRVRDLRDELSDPNVLRRLALVGGAS